MPTTKFKLEAPDLKILVNPTGNKDLFSYGGYGEMTEAAVIALMQAEEDSIISVIPESYSQILSYVSGEYLTDKVLGANEDQTEFQTTFGDLSDLKLYVQYPFATKNWRNRKHDNILSTDSYVVDMATGAITLDPGTLSEGYTLIAEYRHNGADAITALRKLVLNASRLEIYTRFPNWGPSQQGAISEMKEGLQGDILSFYAPDGSARGINLIDRMELVTETRKDSRKGLRMPFLGGW